MAFGGTTTHVSSGRVLFLLLAIVCAVGGACQKVQATAQERQVVDLQCLRGMAKQLIETCPRVTGVPTRDALPEIYSITNQELSKCASFEPLRVSASTFTLPMFMQVGIHANLVPTMKQYFDAVMFMAQLHSAVMATCTHGVEFFWCIHHMMTSIAMHSIESHAQHYAETSAAQDRTSWKGSWSTHMHQCQQIRLWHDL